MFQQSNPSSKKKNNENSNDIIKIFSEFRQISKAGNTTDNSSNLIILFISIKSFCFFILRSIFFHSNINSCGCQNLYLRFLMTFLPSLYGLCEIKVQIIILHAPWLSYLKHKRKS